MRVCVCVCVYASMGFLFLMHTFYGSMLRTLNANVHAPTCDGGGVMDSDLLCMQAAMQSGCESEHVVKVVETILSDAPNSSSVFIVMELCQGGNLRDWMRRSKANRLHSEIVSAPADGKAAA